MLMIMIFLGYKMLFFKSAWARCILIHLTTISWIYKIDLIFFKMLSNKGFKKNFIKLFVYITT